MTVNFNLTSATRLDSFTASAAIGDVTRFALAVGAWEEDNDTVTSVDATSEYGNTGISDVEYADGEVSVTLTFSQSGRTLIQLVLNTAAGLKKTIWINILVRDKEYRGDDYGLCGCQ